MRVALAFFGLPRRSDIAFPSIERHLIEPIAAGADLHVCCHLYRQDRVVNPRNGEDHVLSAADYRPYEQFQCLQEPPHVPSDLLARMQAHGDAWANGFVSLRNLLLQLQSLLAVTRMVAELAPDAVVFARPDLLYHDRLDPAQLSRAAQRPAEVALPAWEAWGGCNDRIAVAGAGAYKAYGGRLLICDHYCETRRVPLHSERLLRHALDFAGIGLRELNLRASRVRADGRIELEDFGGHISPLGRGAPVSQPGRTDRPGP